MQPNIEEVFEGQIVHQEQGITLADVISRFETLEASKTKKKRAEESAATANRLLGEQIEKLEEEIKDLRQKILNNDQELEEQKMSLNQEIITDQTEYEGVGLLFAQSPNAPEVNKIVRIKRSESGKSYCLIVLPEGGIRVENIDDMDTVEA